MGDHIAHLVASVTGEPRLWIVDRGEEIAAVVAQSAGVAGERSRGSEFALEDTGREVKQVVVEDRVEIIRRDDLHEDLAFVRIAKAAVEVIRCIAALVGFRYFTAPIDVAP